MPHFVIDCSESVMYDHPLDDFMRTVHDTAESTGLFKPGDIKVRLNTYKHYTTANQHTPFIHIFAHIMQGRTIEQRADLSKSIITKLKAMFPKVPVISMNVYEFEKATYCNRTMV